MKYTKAHVNTLHYGDTVMINNEMITLSKSNLNRCAFMGTSLNGDSSAKMVTVVLFPKWFKGEIIKYVRQI